MKTTASSAIFTAILAAVGVLAIWVAAPLNGFLLGNSYIAGDFMPAAALALVFVLVLGINPLLRRLAPSLALSRGQLAFLLGVFLVACVTPEAGFMRFGPGMLAHECHSVSRELRKAEIYDVVQPPAVLFPDPLGYEAETPASTRMMGTLEEGESIPWRNWLAPLLAWGPFLLAYWLLLAGMAQIVLPQWRDVERQPMPLLKVLQTLIADPGSGHLLPALFRKRTFWIAAGTVFGLHLLSGLHGYMPSRVPEIPLSWNLNAYFTEGMARNLPGLFKGGRISFLFLGLTFFMPRRTSFSLWSMQVIYGLVTAYVITYLPSSDRGFVTDHRNGAALAIALIVLWTGRRHWQRVFSSLLRRKQEGDEAYRLEAAMLLAGLAGVAAWLMWAGVSPGWAVGGALAILINALVATRLLSETGLPVAPYVNPMTALARLVPSTLTTAASTYFTSFCTNVVGVDWNRVCAGTMIFQGLTLNERASTRGRRRLSLVFLLILAVSVVVAGAVYLMISYANEKTINELWTINSWGSRVLERTAVADVRHFLTGRARAGAVDRATGMLTGIGLALGLQFLCMRFPRWPLHPVALVFALGFFGQWLFASLFLGWLIKHLILHYGGARANRAVEPLFMGLILGEVGAVVFWTAVTGILAGLGMEYNLVRILPN